MPNPERLQREKSSGGTVRLEVECNLDDGISEASLPLSRVFISWDPSIGLEARSSAGSMSISPAEVLQFDGLGISDLIETPAYADRTSKALYELVFLSWRLLVNRQDQQFEEKAAWVDIWTANPGSMESKVDDDRPNDGGHGVVLRAQAQVRCGGNCIGGEPCNNTARNKARDQGTDSDSCGHILARSMGGAGTRDSTFPQDLSVNNGQYNDHESRLLTRFLNVQGGDGRCDLDWKFDFASPTRVRPEGVTYGATCSVRRHNQWFLHNSTRYFFND